MAEATATGDRVTFKIYSKNFLDETMDSNQLLELSAKCLAECECFTKDYIWQRDGFFIAPNSRLDENIKCLSGTIDVGESVEDEWFIIFLLFHISKQFPDFVISVEDSDGEVLLIEAAEHLPKWLNPETSKRRVFICDGDVHVIPLPKTPAELTLWPTGTPSIHTAIALVSGHYNTKANENIREAIEKRINGYPSKLANLHHYAHCYIPTKLAYCLKEKPNLVAASVEALYQRDPVETKAVRSMSRFHPSKRILTRVKFTKLLYSQLIQQNLHPFAKSAWKLPNKSDPHYKAHSLGFKLVCGFEILCNKCKNNEQKEAHPTGPKWKKYLNYLKSSGYFKGELEGSKLYKERLKNAESYFRSFSDHCAGPNQKDHFDVAASDLLDLLEESNNHLNEIENKSEHLLPEDDDGWLTLSPEDLDKMMLDIWGKSDNSKNLGDGYHARLQDVVGGVKNFVDKVSSHEGVETDLLKANNKIKFDDEKFISALDTMLGTKIDKSESSQDSQFVLETDPDSDSDLDTEDEIENVDTRTTCKEVSDSLDPIMETLYDSMSRELRGSNVQKSFDIKDGGQSNSHSEINSMPLDVDVNLVKNFLESFSSQEGLSGPVSNLLHSLGMNLPPDNGNLNDDFEM